MQIQICIPAALSLDTPLLVRIVDGDAKYVVVDHRQIHRQRFHRRSVELLAVVVWSAGIWHFGAPAGASGCQLQPSCWHS
ncbi:Low-affinity inorganic phosphate transporter PitA [Trichinella spiralis]|uniref:Low-affinity inorganic phosphate transporter PitA n=1 Tax=Trichinella spiralis TaxID=6334 RepID=A0ABR3KKC8_TRISP